MGKFVFDFIPLGSISIFVLSQVAKHPESPPAIDYGGPHIRGLNKRMTQKSTCPGLGMPGICVQLL